MQGNDIYPGQTMIRVARAYLVENDPFIIELLHDLVYCVIVIP